MSRSGEVRWLRGPNGLGGFINCACGGTIWYWEDADRDGELEFTRVSSDEDVTRLLQLVRAEAARRVEAEGAVAALLHVAPSA